MLSLPTETAAGWRPNSQTCDTRKGEDAINLNPLNPSRIVTLTCNSRGLLESSDTRFQSDVDERLGLNHRILVDDRPARLCSPPLGAKTLWRLGAVKGISP